MKSSWDLCLSDAAIYGQIFLKINDSPKTDVTQLTYELSTSRELAYSVHRPLPLYYLWCFLIVVTLHTISANWSALDMYTVLTFPGNIAMWEVLSSREPAGRSLASWKPSTLDQRGFLISLRSVAFLSKGYPALVPFIGALDSFIQFKALSPETLII